MLGYTVPNPIPAEYYQKPPHYQQPYRGRKLKCHTDVYFVEAFNQADLDLGTISPAGQLGTIIDD